MSLVAAEAANLRALQSQQPGLFSSTSIDITDTDKPEQVLAEIIIEGPPKVMDLPTEVRSRTLSLWTLNLLRIISCNKVKRNLSNSKSPRAGYVIRTARAVIARPATL